jgi:hypothetical protein
MLFDLPGIQTQHLGMLLGLAGLPLWTISGFKTRHLPPFCALSASGSGRTGSTRLLGSVSLLSCSSLRQRAMSWGLKILAADAGTVFWKKLRSSTFMARFTGGANISSAMEPAIRQAHTRTQLYAFWLLSLLPQRKRSKSHSKV